MKTEIINKIIISEEAVLDYKCCTGAGRLDQRIKTETEEYINIMNCSGHLLNTNYFRCLYYDESSERMLMLFLYRTEKIRIMQNWILAGICEAEDWSEEPEESGQIRVWLKSRIESSDDDWVIGFRANKILKETINTFYGEVVKEVTDAFECGRDKADAEELVFLQSIHFEFRKKRRDKKKDQCNREVH